MASGRAAAGAGRHNGGHALQQQDGIEAHMRSGGIWKATSLQRGQQYRKAKRFRETLENEAPDMSSASNTQATLQNRSALPWKGPPCQLQKLRVHQFASRRLWEIEGGSLTHVACYAT